MVEVEHISLGPPPPRRDHRHRTGSFEAPRQRRRASNYLTPPVATRFWPPRSWRAWRDATNSAAMAFHPSFTPPCDFGCRGLSSTARDVIDALAVAGAWRSSIAELSRVCDMVAGPDYHVCRR